MTDISIVGGGIGGLSTAIACLNHGFDPIVYEAVDEFQPVGSGIGIMPNGMEALDRLGVADAIVDRGIVLDRMELRTADGSRLISRDFHAHVDRLGLSYSMVAIHRADLQATLVNHIPAESLQFGMECVGVNSNQGLVQFDDGTEVVADFIVGADGIDSAVRECLFPGIVSRYTGEVAYRGFSETTSLVSKHKNGVELWDQRLRFGYFPIDDEQMYWVAVVPASSPDDAPPVSPSELAEGYRDFPDPVPELIAATDRDDVVRTPIADLPPLNQWGRGHVALLGDAAHAMTPNLAQGSAQAMEDAIVLVDSLDEHGLNRCALDVYEERRKERAERLLSWSRLQGRLAQVEHPLLTRVRNIAFRFAPNPLLRREMEQMITTDF